MVYDSMSRFPRAFRIQKKMMDQDQWRTAVLFVHLNWLLCGKFTNEQYVNSLMEIKQQFGIN